MRSVLFSYLGEKKHTLLLWMGIELIFVILLSLYRVPSEYYRYPVLLSTVLVFREDSVENIVREGIRYYSKIFILKHLAVETGDLTMVV